MSTSVSSAADHPYATLGRIGYAFKGVLYFLLGVLAFQAARGGGDAEGQRGVLRTVADSSFGGVLLTVLAIGLAAYALWRLAGAILDLEDHGTDAEGLAKRAGYVISAGAYGLLAYASYRILQDGGSGSGGGTQENAQTALALPGGRFVLGAVALGVLGYGIYQFVRAYRASFMDKFALDGIAASHRTTIRRLGQAGLAARGVVYVVIGAALGTAAYQADSSEAVGLDGALSMLRDGPYGTLLLGAVGLGLAAYGLYCGVNAKYRRFKRAG